MKEKILVLVFGLFLGLAFSACSASDEIVPINIPSIDDDVCCSQDDENNINQILAGYKEVTGLSRQSVEGYTLKVYARTANLHVGYNDLYFAVEKTESGRHIKDFEVTALSPLMDMGMMVHSTPIADKYDQIESYPIFHTWVAPLMAGEWTLPIMLVGIYQDTASPEIASRETRSCIHTYSVAKLSCQFSPSPCPVCP